MIFTAKDHVTQREPGPWRDCTFASVLETLRIALPNGRMIPATEAEKERFRAAAGFPDNHYGATIPATIPAAKELYGLTDDQYRITGDWSVIRLALADPTTVAVVTGMMAVVPAHLRRWSPSFTGAHAVAARGNSVSPTWCDPLAPKGTYKGEPVSWHVWETFSRSLPGGRALLMREYEEGSIALPIYQLMVRPGTLTIRAGATVKGYQPAADGWLVAKTWTPKPQASSARFDAVLTRIGGDTVPKNLLRVTSGYFDGLYVSTAEVDEAYD